MKQLIQLFQNLINVIYRHPRARLRTIKRFGGFFSYGKMIIGKRKMRKASFTLAPIPSYSAGIPIYFLTGKDYLFQTLFCAYSLVKVSSEKFHFHIVDDGTLNPKLVRQLKISMPNFCLITPSEILKNLDAQIPTLKYPFLRKKRTIYPHIKKITDVHTHSNHQFKLVLDADMLFFKNPEDLIEIIKNASRCTYMLDCKESYGYTKSLMEKNCSAKIPELLNAGALAINSNDINWHNLNQWINELETNEGTSYFLEQALSAMIVAPLKKQVLDPKKYIVNPSKLHEGEVLHHYVDLSKKYYYEKAWKIIYE